MVENKSEAVFFFLTLFFLDLCVEASPYLRKYYVESQFIISAPTLVPNQDIIFGFAFVFLFFFSFVFLMFCTWSWSLDISIPSLFST